MNSFVGSGVLLMLCGFVGFTATINTQSQTGDWSSSRRFDAHKRAKAYADRFRKLGLGELQRLTADPDTGSALQAAWELARAGTVVEPFGGVELNRERVQRFLKFIEGRLGVAVPTEWEAAILSGEQLSTNHAIFHALSWPLPHQTRFGIRINTEARVEEGADWFTVSINQRVARLPASIFKQAEESVPHEEFRFAIGEARSFLASYLERGFMFQLKCFASESGKLLWQEQVWAIGLMASSGPISRVHNVMLVQTEDAIIVFGIESHGLYIEAFKSDTGECKFRFCTSYGSSEKI